MRPPPAYISNCYLDVTNKYFTGIYNISRLRFNKLG
jgi:hypothetical protein